MDASQLTTADTPGSRCTAQHCLGLRDHATISGRLGLASILSRGIFNCTSFGNRGISAVRIYPHALPISNR